MDFSQKVNRKTKKNIASKGNQVPEWPRWPSGSSSLDVELGGGVPKGNIIDIVGDYSSGKTAVALLMLGEYQKVSDKPVAWIDAEGCWDPKWAAALGVDTAKVDVVRPSYGEQAYEIILAAYEEGAGLVILDSAAALASKKELEGDMESIEVGGMSKIHAKFMRKIDKGWEGKEDDPPTFIFLNQYIMNVGAYGAPLIERGGKALTEYFPAVKIQLKTGEYFDGKKTYKYIGQDDEGVEVKAQAIKFYITKNKTAPPKRRGHFWFYFDTLDSRRRKGTVDTVEECVRLAMKYGIVEQSVTESGKKGGMYTYLNRDTGETRTFKGSAALADYILSDEHARKYIQNAVLERVIGDMSGEEETRENKVQEESVAQLRVIRDDEAERTESSEAV